MKSAFAFATATDDMGRCANVVSKLILGGCFVSGTLVTLSAIPRDEALESAIWNGDELGYEKLNWLSRSGSSTEVALPVTSRSLQVPIEEVPLSTDEESQTANCSRI